MITLKNVVLTLEQADTLASWGFTVQYKNNELIIGKEF